MLEATEGLEADVVATAYGRRTCTRRLRAGWLVPVQRISYGANDYMFHWDGLASFDERSIYKKQEDSPLDH